MILMRPRTAGEIFDRGLGVLIRSAARAGALLAVAVALAVAGAGLVFSIPGDAAKGVVAIVLLLVAVVPLLWIAGGIAYLFGCVASDRPCTFRDALRQGRRRSLSLFGTSLLGYFVILSVFVPVVLVVLGATAILSLRMPTALSVAVAVVAGIPSILFCIAAYALATAIVYVSWSACVFEDRNPVEALRAALKRCCSRAQLKRAIAVGLATIAPAFAIELIFALGTAAFVSTQPSAGDSKVTLAAIGVLTAVRMAAELFGSLIGIAWCTVFSLDARIRLEGLDLSAALVEAERPITAS